MVRTKAVLQTAVVRQSLDFAKLAHLHVPRASMGVHRTRRCANETELAATREFIEHALIVLSRADAADPGQHRGLPQAQARTL